MEVVVAFSMNIKANLELIIYQQICYNGQEIHDDVTY